MSNEFRLILRSPFCGDVVILPKNDFFSIKKPHRVMGIETDEFLT
ncbi:MAG: hypothetical protein V7K24_29860 [Nostoc sp.]